MEQTKERILEEAGQFINILLVYDEKYTGKNPWVPTRYSLKRLQF